MALNSSDKTANDANENISEFLQNDSAVTFESLGLKDVLCETCNELKWKTPSKIQQESIPVALEGKDVIGLAETGSGKTGAFCLPILQVSHTSILIAMQ